MNNINPVISDCLKPFLTLYKAELSIENWFIKDKYLHVEYYDNVNNKEGVKKWHVNFLKTWIGLEEPDFRKMFVEKDVDDQYDGTDYSIRTISFTNWDKVFAHPELDDIVRRFFNYFMINNTIRKINKQHGLNE